MINFKKKDPNLTLTTGVPDVTLLKQMGDEENYIKMLELITPRYLNKQSGVLST